tara:strand:+ start:8279 stop:9112 length:834 start_codon:yes stop_codon:yes gene_type:complete
MKNNIKLIKKLEEMSKRLRLHAIDMGLHSGEKGSHLGGSLSCVEIMSVLFGHLMKFDVKNPHWERRDRFIPSKAHCGLSHFPALADVGFFNKDDVADEYIKDGGYLYGHPMDIKIGLEYSGGSLGMALSFAIGIALSNRSKKINAKTYLLVGDGELHEGSIWESFMAASHFKLSNIIVIVDRNGLCMDGPIDDVMSLGDLKMKLESFGWNVNSCDGHDISSLLNAFSNSSDVKPNIIIADTIKGKGIDFMENKIEWHFSSLTQEQYDDAKSQILEKY